MRLSIHVGALAVLSSSLLLSSSIAHTNYSSQARLLFSKMCWTAAKIRSSASERCLLSDNRGGDRRKKRRGRRNKRSRRRGRRGRARGGGSGEGGGGGSCTWGITMRVSSSSVLLLIWEAAVSAEQRQRWKIVFLLNLTTSENTSASCLLYFTACAFCSFTSCFCSPTISCTCVIYLHLCVSHCQSCTWLFSPVWPRPPAETSLSPFVCVRTSNSCVSVSCVIHLICGFSHEDSLSLGFWFFGGGHSPIRSCHFNKPWQEDGRHPSKHVKVGKRENYYLI